MNREEFIQEAAMRFLISTVPILKESSLSDESIQSFLIATNTLFEQINAFVHDKYESENLIGNEGNYPKNMSLTNIFSTCHSNLATRICKCAYNVNIMTWGDLWEAYRRDCLLNLRRTRDFGKLCLTTLSDIMGVKL